MINILRKPIFTELLILMITAIVSGCGGGGGGGSDGNATTGTTNNALLTHPYLNTTVGNVMKYSDGDVETIAANENNKLTINSVTDGIKTQITAAVTGNTVAVESLRDFNAAGSITGTTTLSPALKIFPASTSVGSSETQAVTLTSSSGTQSWTCTLTVKAVETVTVTAGTYPNSLKIQRTCVDASNAANIVSDYYSWYAPNVGSVKEQDIETDAVVQLVSSGSDTPSTPSTTPTPTPTASVVTVSSSISSPTTWETGKVYVVGRLTVNSALTIQPGAIVKFMTGGSIDVSASGIINAVGSSAQPIIFTSIKDDSRGGVTNGNVLNPAVGAWNQITLNSSGSTFDRCEFYYSGGNSSYKSALVLGGSLSNNQSASITNSVFAHNDGGNVADSHNPLGVINAKYAAAGTVIAGNTFFDNNVPFSISGLFSVDNSNSFHDPADPSVNNKYNGIFLVGHSSKQITGTINFSETEVPFVFAGDVSVPASSTLTLGDDVIIKFFSSVDNLRINGILKADASVGKRIVFTSMKDDAHGGDTNGDGDTTPAAGDWDSIDLVANGSSFNRSEVYYGGHNVSALRIGVGLTPTYSASVKNSIFAHNNGGNFSDIYWDAFGALNARSAAAGTIITGNTFYNNSVPLRISGEVSIDDSNVFHDPADPSVKNTYNGICFAGGSAINFLGQIDWQETEVPFVLQGSLTIPVSSTLTVGSGVVVKINNSVSEIRVSGTLNIPSGGVTFTSLKDDTLLGDTNNDPISSPAIGDWKGIWQGAPQTTGVYIRPAGATMKYNAKP